MSSGDIFRMSALAFVSLPRILLSTLFIIIVLVVLLAGGANRYSKQVMVQEKPDRVLLAWSGPVEAPMRDQIAGALDQYRNDKRRLIISLNSPGGSVAHGREVTKAILLAGNLRQIETFVDKDAICASMCVPIYLVGATRIADPKARFMFHEASMAIPGLDRIDRIDRTYREEITSRVKNLEHRMTDDIFLSDLDAPRVATDWRVQMRRKIAGRDIWLTGKQLMEQNSGVVDSLVFSSR